LSPGIEWQEGKAGGARVRNSKVVANGIHGNKQQPARKRWSTHNLSINLTEDAVVKD